jgi:hypothetical protein
LGRQVLSERAFVVAPEDGVLSLNEHNDVLFVVNVIVEIAGNIPVTI